MTWEKINLITKKDRIGVYDEYKCSQCGFKKKYYGIGNRQLECPKCKKVDIYGVWKHKSHIVTCPYCHSNLIECPKEHSNAKYLHLQRYKDEVLTICPNGCLEDGSSIIIKKKKKRKKII